MLTRKLYDSSMRRRNAKVKPKLMRKLNKNNEREQQKKNLKMYLTTVNSIRLYILWSMKGAKSVV